MTLLIENAVFSPRRRLRRSGVRFRRPGLPGAARGAGFPDAVARVPRLRSGGRRVRRELPGGGHRVRQHRTVDRRRRRRLHARHISSARDPLINASSNFEPTYLPGGGEIDGGASSGTISYQFAFCTDAACSVPGATVPVYIHYVLTVTDTPENNAYGITPLPFGYIAGLSLDYYGGTPVAQYESCTYCSVQTLPVGQDVLTTTIRTNTVYELVLSADSTGDGIASVTLDSTPSVLPTEPGPSSSAPSSAAVFRSRRPGRSCSWVAAPRDRPCGAGARSRRRLRSSPPRPPPRAWRRSGSGGRDRRSSSG